MNFLAHLYLSCDNEDLLIGNMIADFITNKEAVRYPDSIQKGIQLHRQIDHYTDTHPVVRQGTHRLRVHHGKYAPVVIDVLYDHLLARNWDRYSGESLASFTNSVYEILTRRMSEMPPKLRKILPAMIADRWLERYGTMAGLAFVFGKMKKRARFPSAFELAPLHLRQDYEIFNEEFNQFFPDVIQFTTAYCAC